MNTSAIIGIVVAIMIVVGGIFVYNNSMQNGSMATTATTNDSATMPASDTATQGVMVGGALMTPNRDIVANAMNASNVTTVVAAVKAAGLVATLQSAGPFTVFAPNNAAFDKLPAGTVATLLKPENKSKLVDILTYHVVAGRYTSADLHDGQVLTGQLSVNGMAMVETPDVISSNGVTFVIDSVLLPPAK
jgi:uncharacterized surface protein with fasciclin (FAS1) repeats